MQSKMSLKEWLPLLGITVSAFIFNTSEFMPIGLLTDIADSFHITEAHAGVLITVYSWIVMLLSLPLMLLLNKIDFKRLLLGTIALFGIFQMLSAFSASYGMLMISRIGVACTHSVFWSIASPGAVSVVSEKFRSLALSMVVTGTSIAMILGLPLGRIIGLHMGWNMAFFCVGVIAFITTAYMIFVFPKVPGGESFSIKQMPEILKNKTLMGIFLVTFLFATSYYTGYSYIEPFLQKVAGLSANWVTTTLTIFGAAGLLGSFLFSHYYDKNKYLFIRLVMISVAAALLLLYPVSKAHMAVVVLCAFWGMAVMAFNVTFQSEIITYAPTAASSVAMAIYSGIYNLGIGSGTWIGGSICIHLSISYIGMVGGVIAVVAAVICIFVVIKYMKEFDRAS